MKEISDILRAYEPLRTSGIPCALASVVAVDGSAYRRPGARMLIAANGTIVGGVSGGCIERDVISRAGGVTLSGKPVVIRYDTSLDTGEAHPWTAPGQSLGCGGAIDVLIEPVTRDHDPLQPLATLWQARTPGVLATVIASSHPDYAVADRLAPENATFAAEARLALETGRSRNIEFDLDQGLIRVLFEYIQPPLQLFLFGAGPDAAPLVGFAQALGWHVTVVDMRSASAAFSQSRADLVIRVASSQLAQQVNLPAGAAVVVMTHNYEHDLAALKYAVHDQQRNGPLLYLGILGPKRRSADMLAEMNETTAGDSHASAFYPVGLDIGAQEPEEVALAIVSEITAVLRRSPAGFLRDRNGPIHPRPIDQRAVSTSKAICPIAAS